MSSSCSLVDIVQREYCHLIVDDIKYSQTSSPSSILNMRGRISTLIAATLASRR